MNFRLALADGRGLRTGRGLLAALATEKDDEQPQARE
jgi:hypothetical protein